MIVCIADVLSAEEVAELDALLARGSFEDGRTTAGWHARQVKANLQLRSGSKALRRAQQLVSDALLRNELFQQAVRPKRLRPVLVSRCEPGHGYGTHVDDALMGGGAGQGTLDWLRTDVSFTVFLSPPDAYEGGELVMESSAGETAYKLDAGSAICYPATTLHRVEPVASGVRHAAVGWAQSLVQDAHQRETLFDLYTARQQVYAARGKSETFDLLSRTYANLLRLWAAP